jgi:hypothetical protein
VAPAEPLLPVPVGPGELAFLRQLEHLGAAASACYYVGCPKFSTVFYTKSEAEFGLRAKK